MGDNFQNLFRKILITSLRFKDRKFEMIIWFLDYISPLRSNNCEGPAAVSLQAT